MKVRNSLIFILIGTLFSFNTIAQPSTNLDSLKSYRLNNLDYKLEFLAPLRDGNEKSTIKLSRFNSNTLPFFCKMEHQLQLKSRIPVKIRLGNVDYVNKMESKD